MTAHGLGHLTRSCQIASALCELAPSVDLEFWTAIDRDRVAADFRGPFRHRSASYEPGTAQRSCFELDVARTVDLYRAVLDQRESALAEERAAIRQSGCDALICDVPGVAVRAASDLGVPAILVSNFTWDWILEPILRGTPAEEMVDRLRDEYRRARHHIVLPFGPGGSVCPSNEPGPLVSRRAELSAEEVFRRLAMDRDRRRPVALVCPGGWDPEGWGWIRADTRGFDRIVVGDLPIELGPRDRSLPHALPSPLRFPDLVAASDVVLAKPGYGIASECVTHRTPLVTIDRPGFRETDTLRQALARYGPSGVMSLEDFFHGRWTHVLEEVLGAASRWSPNDADGADRRIATRILEILGWDG